MVEASGSAADQAEAGGAGAPQLAQLPTDILIRCAKMARAPVILVLASTCKVFAQVAAEQELWMSLFAEAFECRYASLLHFFTCLSKIS